MPRAGKPWTIQSDPESWDYGLGSSNTHYIRHELVRGELQVSIRPEFRNGNTRLNLSAYPTDHSLGQHLAYLPYDPKKHTALRQSFPSISVAADREPRVIAKEIERRIVPEADRLIAACKVRKAKDLAYKSETKETAERLAQLAGVKAVEHNGEYSFDVGRGQDRRIDFRVTSPESVSIERAYLTNDLAAVLIEAAVKFFKRASANAEKEKDE